MQPAKDKFMTSALVDTIIMSVHALSCKMALSAALLAANPIHQWTFATSTTVKISDH